MAMTMMSKRRAATAALLGSTALVAAAGFVPARANESVVPPNQVAQAAASYDFDIPSGPLGGALTLFGEVSGLKVLVPSDLVRDRTTAGVSGRFNPERALRQLLSGTGLVWRFTDAGTVTLERAPSAGAAMQLDPVTVQGQAGTSRRGDPVRTEGNPSYTTPVATVGGKGAVPIREIPQSVSVVTRQRIDDQNMTQLEDAMQRTTGMRVLANDPGRGSIFVRGFEPDTATVDGLPAPISSQYGTQPDLFMFDRIEVLRGPAGLFAGTGEPGGTVNMVRKRALDEFAAKGAATAGSWDYYRGEVDVTTPLVESSRVRGRVAAAFQDQDTYVNVTHNRHKSAYGTVEADLNEATTLSVALSRQEKDLTPFNGLPAFSNGELLDVDRSTFIGADWNRFGNHSNEVFTELEHRFDDGGHVKAGMRYVDRFVDFKYAQPSQAAGVTHGVNTVTLRAFGRQYWEESVTLDGHISKPFEGFGQTHNILLGTDYRRYDQKTFSGTGSNFATVNIYNPVYTFTDQSLSFTTRTANITDQYSGYGQLRVKPATPVTAIVGGRVSSYHLESTNQVTGAVTTDDRNGQLTPYAGLVVDLNRNISAYGSYTEIFQPQTTTDSAGKILAPRVGDQYEVGLKGEFLDKRLNGQLALFRIRDQNRAVTINGSSVAAGEAESRGVELELSGTILPGWEVFSGYAYLLAEHQISSGTTGGLQQGEALAPGTPKHTFNLWTRYTFGEGPLEGFSVGGGGRALSSYHAQSSTSGTRWIQDGYAVFDAQFGYALNEHLDAALTVSNILDKEYYDRVGGAQLFNYYGDPRSVMLRVGAKL